MEVWSITFSSIRDMIKLFLETYFMEMQFETTKHTFYTG